MIRFKAHIALLLAATTGAAAVLVPHAAMAAEPSPPFVQCPAVALDTSCAILIVINPDSSVTVLGDPSQGPYEADEDTLVGVVNNSGSVVDTLSLTGTSDIPPFAFEGDGACAGWDGGPTDCPFGPTGYEGPGTAFSNISPAMDSGNVDFTGGLAAGGGSAWFSLEGVVTTSNLLVKPLESPIAVLGMTISATEGSVYSGPVASFVDPDPGSTSAEYAATVNWGDGSAPSAGTLSGPVGGPYTVNGVHTFPDPGTRVVSVNIADTDNLANNAAASSTATVNDATLTVTAAPQAISAVEGGTFMGAVGTFSDANPQATTMQFHAMINWGDSSAPSSGTLSGPVGGPFTVSGVHTYADESNPAISVSVTDAGGSSITTGSAGIVTDAPLTATGVTTTSTQDYSGVVATFGDANTTTSGLADFTATVDWGDGSPSSNGTVTATGGAYAVAGAHRYATTGYFTVKTHIVDDGGSTSDAVSQVLIFATASGGNFVIGDQGSPAGTSVTFWGAQWWKQNTVSGGNSAPPSFKGFEDTPALPGCGTSWSTDPGNSTPPPAGPLPAYMAVIVSSWIGKAGPSISGNTTHILVVRTDAGYAPNSGHAGTGTVVATYC